MNTQKEIDFNRIKKAIKFISENHKLQPSLDDIAQEINLSPIHFQKLCSDWAGVSPKKFLQYTNINYAKSLLREQQATLFDTAIDTRLSSTSRLHDLFIGIEAMSPAEYKNFGENLTISYSFSSTLFGNSIAASTERGLCHLAFIDSVEDGLLALQNRFPKAHFTFKKERVHTACLSFLTEDYESFNKVKLHVKGSEFQLKVWQALLKIPNGNLNTYGRIAKEIGKPTASRAVGTAI
ncbi:MAG: AraC family transcriptional regulator of adaptative response, partial [Flavobacteriales bacterium]